MHLGLGLVFFIAVLFIGRSAYVQIFQGEHYKMLSSQNREYLELLVPTRGSVMDKQGVLLAWNEPAFVLTMTLDDLPTGEDRDVLFARVANLIGAQPTDLDLLISQYASRPFDPIPVKDDIAYESAIRLAIEVSDLPGFSLTTRTKRVYSSSTSSLSHVLGYTGLLSVSDIESGQAQGYRLIDSIGKSGIEREYEGVMRGIPGRLVFEVDALGNKLSILSKEEPELGSNLTLAIHAEFQAFIQQELEAVFHQSGATRGSVVALDPRTGAVHALVSLPTYDANEFIDGISSERYTALLEDEDQPLFFRAISGEFPSGSTFKPVVAYGALAEGIVEEHTSFVSTGGLRIGQWFFPDWKAGGHGVTDVRKALSESVNTYFYIIGGGFDTVTGLGVERIADYAKRFGFGATTGIDLPNEADGFLPSKEWKQDVKGERWYVGDTYHLAIGQG
ncbi:MAG: Penicillin-binding protein 2, partial [Candidatus Uhrbacteria bacterium GW2011_GWA2_52_8d]